MQMARLGAMDLPTALALLIGAAVCYAAWLTSIVFCAVHGARPLLIAAAPERALCLSDRAGLRV
jgi:hypothetical protein